ncbi:hypothetical protein, partial [Acetobacter lovaniensis]|uniref:hypothetical protein n=1 Tax=Acetobacter lovaniensis TaxID=104100 RepID=UPI0031EA0B8F
WSSPVARQAHNLKAAGSNPAPATKISKRNQLLKRRRKPPFCVPEHQLESYRNHLAEKYRVATTRARRAR